MWDAYLATDPSSDGFAASAADVFRAIDVNRNLTVSVDELSAFLDTVNSKGLVCNDTASSFLRELGEDHELDEEEFRQFLNLATNPGGSGGNIDGDGDAASMSERVNIAYKTSHETAEDCLEQIS